jgi:hypothetical protein
LINKFIIRQTETGVLKLLLCILDTTALKFAIGLKLVAMIFAVSFEIIIQRAMGNKSLLSNEKHFHDYSIIQ